MLYRIAQPVGPSAQKGLVVGFNADVIGGFRGFSIAHLVSTEVNPSVRASWAATLLDFESAVRSGHSGVLLFRKTRIAIGWASDRQTF